LLNGENVAGMAYLYSFIYNITEMPTKKDKKIIVVMPAYNAAATISKTIKDIPKGLVDEIIVVDDGSKDNTVEICKKLHLTTFEHDRNKGYGANQKTCYKKALEHGADVVVMLHPDNQYDGTLIGELVRPITTGRFKIMLGSRIRTRKEALEGGMPFVKYVTNRVVSLIENIVLGVNLTEHLSGFRAYSREVLTTLPIQNMSNDFVFDQEFIVSAIAQEFPIAEYPIPVRYGDDSSSIGYIKGIKFLLETGFVLVKFSLFKTKIYKDKIFV
jgi:glycosyltransferase involved in cell wall biosynthesis